MKRTICTAITSAAITVCISCTTQDSMPEPSGAGSQVTQAMRDACPLLSDEVIEGFLLAISGLRDNGLSEEDALQQWVGACENIPPDGNFQGDVEACTACMPALVEGVYAAASASDD